jgi:predicted nucleic acid-binding protein
MILVDSSVWIELFRGRTGPTVTRLKSQLGREDLLIGDLILAELLQGVRDEREARMIEQAFVHYRVVDLVGEAIARESARSYRLLRKQGITVRKTVDCLVATWCIRHGVALLHADRDFEPFVGIGLIEA